MHGCCRSPQNQSGRDTHGRSLQALVQPHAWEDPPNQSGKVPRAATCMVIDVQAFTPQCSYMHGYSRQATVHGRGISYLNICFMVPLPLIHLLLHPQVGGLDMPERPHAPSAVAAFMSAYIKTPYITPSMDFSSGTGVVRRRRGQQQEFTSM